MSVEFDASWLNPAPKTELGRGILDYVKDRPKVSAGLGNAVVVPFNTTAAKHFPRPTEYPSDTSILAELPTLLRNRPECVAELLNDLYLPPSPVRVVPDPARRSPSGREIRRSRVVTPRYIWDVDCEEQFCGGTIARTFAHIAYSIAAELLRRYREALVRHTDSECTSIFEQTPLEVYIKREGFMLELWAWTIAGGVVESTTANLAKE